MITDGMPNQLLLAVGKWKGKIKKIAIDFSW